MPGISLWLVLLIFLPRFTSGRLGPSKTNIGKKVVCMRVAQRKNSVRSTGFSPSRPYSAWKNQILASIPRQNPRLPSGFASKPSLIARSVNDLVLAAGRRTLNGALFNELTRYRIKVTHIPKTSNTHFGCLNEIREVEKYKFRFNRLLLAGCASIMERGHVNHRDRIHRNRRPDPIRSVR